MTNGKVILFRPQAEPEILYVDRKEPWIPFSLLTIGSQLSEAGYEVKILDGYFISNYEDILKTQIDNNVIFIGITALTGYQIHDGIEFAKVVRKINANIPIVWGGFHPSLIPIQTVNSKYVDIVVKGQGEITIVELTKCLANNSSLNEIYGLVYKQNGNIMETPDRPLSNINKFSPYLFNLIEVEKYISTKYIWIGNKMINYLSSQGCPFKCNFCAEFQVRKRNWSGLSPERVIKDIKFFVKNYDVNAIYFCDSNFFGNKERALEISMGFIKEGLNVGWFVNARVDQLNKFSNDNWKLMKDSGCKQFLIGAESGSQQILDYIGKNITVEDTMKFLKKCKDFNIIAECSLMVGFPESPKDDFRDTIHLIDKIISINKENRILVFFYTPYPGTPLFEKSIENGFVPPTSLEEWSKFSLKARNTPWVDKNLEHKFHFIIDHVFNYAFLPNLKDSYIKKSRSLIPYYLYRILALLRWKYKFFHFPFELWIKKLVRILANK